jgi:predicted nuclease with TOPRIM domain
MEGIPIEPITDTDELLEKGGQAGLVPGPYTEQVYYKGWGPITNGDYLHGGVESGEERKITKIVPRPNYNGGSCWVGEQASKEDIDTVAKDISITFNYISAGLNLAKFATGQFAKMDFAKDIKSAQKKLNNAQNSAFNQINQLNQAGEGITGLAEQVDELRDEVKDFADDLSKLLSDMKAFDPILSSLQNTVELAVTKVNSETAKLDTLKATKPAITSPGYKTWLSSVKAQQLVVTNAKTDENKAKQNFDKTVDDANKVRNEYNDLRTQAQPKAEQLIDNVKELSNREQAYANALNSLNSSFAQRSEAIKDMSKAQETFANKIRTSFNLGQMALGAQGLRDGFSYIQAQQYYSASASMITAGYEASLPSLEVNGLTPYTLLIRKAIISAGKIMESGGNFQDYVLDFGEATISLQKMMAMERVLENASWLNETGQEYEAWSMIADQTAIGCEILGTIGETVSQFYPTPIPVGPAIRPAMKVVGGITSGSLQTLVSAGQKASQDEFFSAPLGTGRVSGVSLFLFSPFAIGYNAPAQVFGKGEPPAQVIRDMALAGAPMLTPPQMIINVSLRPTMPSAPNPMGRDFPAVYTNTGEE